MSETFKQSLIQEYTKAWVTAMQESLGDGVLVTDGPPPAAYLQMGNVVWVGEASGQQNTVGLSPSPETAAAPKAETFNLQCIISIFGPTTPSATNTHSLQADTAFGILETIGAKLREDPTLGLSPSANGGYVMYSQIGSGIRVRKGGSDNARETTLEFSINGAGYI